jgi:hypothetical protein
MLAAWTSAFEIAEILDDADYRLRALWGLYVDCFTSGRYRAALAVAERFCAHATKTTILPTGQSATDWSAWRYLSWVA